jgi:hypothetical protein
VKPRGDYEKISRYHELMRREEGPGDHGVVRRRGDGLPGERAPRASEGGRRQRNRRSKT